MKNKTMLLTGTVILAIILFSVSTYMQKKLINYEPKIECLFVKEDIKANQKLEEEMFYKDEIDISLISNTKIIQNYDEIKNLYAKDNIYKGQIALQKQFDTKENLSIYEIENRKRKNISKNKKCRKRSFIRNKRRSINKSICNIKSRYGKRLFKQ